MLKILKDGEIMRFRRRRMSKRKSRRVFRKGSSFHKRNVAVPMRGGLRI